MNKFRRLFRYDWPMHFSYLITNWLPDNVVFLKFRGWLMSHFLGKCGRKLSVGRNVTFYNPSMIEIGDKNYFAYGNLIIPGGKIIIGNQNIFGPYSVFVAGNHLFDGKTFYNELADDKDIIIGNDNWVGANCSILGGTIIKNQSLIGAGAILLKELPDNCRYISKHNNIIVENLSVSQIKSQ